MIRTNAELDHEGHPFVLLNVAAMTGEPPTFGHSQVNITIGDVNDNPMAPGYSDIFVYNYEGKAPDTQVSMSQNLSFSPTA